MTNAADESPRHPPDPRLGLQRHRRPLSQVVRDMIADEFIASGAVPAGALLPSEHQLSKRYRVSRVTIRAALHGLRDAGLVAIRQGVGTTVLPRTRAVTHGLDRLVSIETFAREADHVATTENVEFEEFDADATIAARLDRPPGTRVMCVRRVKRIDEQPAAWLVDYVAADTIPFDVLRSEFQGSVLDVLLSSSDQGAEYADAEHTPVLVPEDVATRLDIEPGVAALHVDSTVWTADGRVAAWALGWLLPAHFRFVVRRRRGPNA